MKPRSITAQANMLWAIFLAATIVYLLITVLVVTTVGGLNPSADFSILLISFIVISASSIALIAYSQTSPHFLASSAREDPSRRNFLVMSFGSILAEANAIYGMLLSLLSGSLIYALGFSALSWILLVFVRARFKSNLKDTPAPTN